MEANSARCSTSSPSCSGLASGVVRIKLSRSLRCGARGVLAGTQGREIPRPCFEGAGSHMRARLGTAQGICDVFPCTPLLFRLRWRPCSKQSAGDSASLPADALFVYPLRWLNLDCSCRCTATEGQFWGEKSYFFLKSRKFSLLYSPQSWLAFSRKGGSSPSIC